MLQKVIFSLFVYFFVSLSLVSVAPNSSPLQTLTNYVVSPVYANEVENAKSGPKQTSTSDSCGLFTLPECISKGLTNLINVTLTQITGFLLYISGAMLDYSIHFSVVAFSDFVQATEKFGVYDAWKIIRNLFNIIVVFILLKLSIQKILSGLDLPMIGSFSAARFKRVIMSLIVFTLLVNFSFFFTKVLIDVSNIFTLQFYAATGSTPKASASDAFSNSGISGQVMTVLGLQKIVAKKGELTLGKQDVAESSLNTLATNTITGALLANIFIVIAAFVFLQAAFLFALRTVALIILLFGSPLMFAKGVVGFLDGWSNKWWKLLFEQLFVAPIFMLMLFLTLYIGNGVSTTIGQSAGKDSMLGAVFTFVIMIFLLLSCTKIAKMFGGYSANVATSWGADVFGTVVGGGAGAVGRSTLGRYASHVATNDSWLGNKLRNAATGAGAGGAFARSTLQLADYTAKQNYDVRNSTAVQGSLQKLSGTKLGGTAEKRDFITLREQSVTDQKNMIKERRESVGARWEGAKRDASTGKYQAVRFDENTGAALGYASGYIDDIFGRRAGETETEFRERMVSEAKAASVRKEAVARELKDTTLPDTRRAELEKEKKDLEIKSAYKDFSAKKTLEDNVKRVFEDAEDTRKKAIVTKYQNKQTSGEKIAVTGQAIVEGAKAYNSSTSGFALGDATKAMAERFKAGDARADKNMRTLGGSYIQADIRSKVVSEYEKAEKKAAEAEAKKARVEEIKKKEIELFNKAYEEYAERLGKDKSAKEKSSIPEIVEEMDEDIKELEAKVSRLKKEAAGETSSVSGLLGADGRPLGAAKTPEEIKRARDDFNEANRMLQQKKYTRTLLKDAPKTKHISESAGWSVGEDGAK